MLLLLTVHCHVKQAGCKLLDAADRRGLLNHHSVLDSRLLHSRCLDFILAVKTGVRALRCGHSTQLRRASLCSTCPRCSIGIRTCHSRHVLGCPVACGRGGRRSEQHLCLEVRHAHSRPERCRLLLPLLLLLREQLLL